MAKVFPMRVDVPINKRAHTLFKFKQSAERKLDCWSPFDFTLLWPRCFFRTDWMIVYERSHTPQHAFSSSSSRASSVHYDLTPAVARCVSGDRCELTFPFECLSSIIFLILPNLDHPHASPVCRVHTHDMTPPQATLPSSCSLPRHRRTRSGSRTPPTHTTPHGRQIVRIIRPRAYTCELKKLNQGVFLDACTCVRVAMGARRYKLLAITIAICI